MDQKDGDIAPDELFGEDTTDPVGPTLDKAKEAPEKDVFWDEAEELAATHQRPDDVASAYRSVLAKPLTKELANRIGRRAVRFHDEWFQDNAELSKIAVRVLEVDPGSEWALDRLSLLFTGSERWDDLLATYDRALAEGDLQPARAESLLDEAANIARDFARQPERAIGYLEKLVVRKPGDTKLALALERLLEKMGRPADLVKLFRIRLPVVSKEQGAALHARIASIFLDRLAQPADALAEAEIVLDDAQQGAAMEALVEKIASVADTEKPPRWQRTRARALDLLRARYGKRVDDLVRALAGAVNRVEGDERTALHREIATLLINTPRPERAVPHLAEVVVATPQDEATRGTLRDLATRTGQTRAYAEALSRTTPKYAELRAQLWNEAATVFEAENDGAAAASVLQRLLADKELDAAAHRHAARALAVLLRRLDRTAELLDVLERRAALEPTSHERRAVLIDLAGLADRHGELERSLAAWRRATQEGGEDDETLDSQIDLLRRLDRKADLVGAIRRRTNKPSSSAGARGDLEEIAAVEVALGDPAGAITTWNDIRRRFGDDEASIDALSTLLPATNQHEELAQLLERSIAEAADDRKAELLARLGDAQRGALGEPDAASLSYKQALVLNPKHDGARRGLHALLADPHTAATAAQTLSAAYTKTDEWDKLLSILEARLTVAENDDERALLLLDAATLQEKRGFDPVGALHSMCRAFVLAGDDGTIEAELGRLAEVTGRFADAVDAYEQVIAKTKDPVLATHLRHEVASLLEGKLDDPERAYAALRAVLDAHPNNLDAAEGAARNAARADKWTEAADVLVKVTIARAAVEERVLAALEDVAEKQHAFAALAESVATALVASREVPRPLARDLEIRLAAWFRDRANDAKAAESALSRAVSHDRTSAEALRLLASLRRAAPSAALVETLLMLADAEASAEGNPPPELVALNEAAEVALAIDHGKDETTAILRRLYEGAAIAWTAHADEPDAEPLEKLAEQSIEELVKLALTRGDRAGAADLLVEGAALPFGTERARSMRHRAAEILAATPNGDARALALYEALLTELPADQPAIDALAALYAKGGQTRELLALRRNELLLPTASGKALTLRLEIARLAGILGDRDGLVAALLANLDERPGHEASLAELTKQLDADKEFGELADVLAAQAELVEKAPDGDWSDDAIVGAETLWSRLALVAEESLKDPRRAAAAYERAAILEPKPATLDALARVQGEVGAHGEAARALERRLAVSTAAERTQVRIRLAEARMAAGERDHALDDLRVAAIESPTDEAVLNRVAQLYRSALAWEPLGELLEAGAGRATDPAMQHRLLRDAAEVYVRKLGAPERAVPLLENAVAKKPTDRSTRTALADALRAAGRLDEATKILLAMLDEFGRRRPPERAVVHLALAQVARQKSDDAAALAELEQATTMDMSHPGILRELGEVALAAGQLDRAERAYRALLLVVRRGPSASPPGEYEPVGAAEVLLALSRIAEMRQDEDRAREMLDSAFEASAEDDESAIRFERGLRESGRPDLLARALRSRIARTAGDSKAEALAELAAVLDEGIGAPDEALEALLEALDVRPGRADLHEQALELAQRRERLVNYADALAKLVMRADQRNDIRLACDLSVRLAELAAKELHDQARAEEALTRAESMAGDRLDVLRALERAYEVLGDQPGRVRILKRISANDDPTEAIRATYELAEAQLTKTHEREAGLATLREATDRDPRLADAVIILRKAADVAPEDRAVGAAYEEAARTAEDQVALLDALERATALGDMTLVRLREAAELAAEMNEHPRAEKLYRAAAALAVEGSTGLAAAVWAATAIAAYRRAESDFAGALEWLQKAAKVAERRDARRLDFEVAALAATEVGDLSLAAETYERLRASDPSDREAWEPLLDVYRRKNDAHSLEKVLSSTEEVVLDTAGKNRLRLERARLYLGPLGHIDEAITLLIAILDEDPDDNDTARELLEVYGREGRENELRTLLGQRLERAKRRRDVPEILALTHRLGGHMPPDQRPDAIRVYRSALEYAPADKHLLESLYGLGRAGDPPHERGDVIERLLALEENERAADLALELAERRVEMGDHDGQVRAIVKGIERAPRNEALRQRLEELYTERGDLEALARAIVADGERRGEREGVARLRQAAALYRDQLSRQDLAADTLRKARVIAPDDMGLLNELCFALASSNAHEGAIDELSAAIEVRLKRDADWVQMLRMRASLSLGLAKDESAVTDLEQAYEVAPADVMEELAAALDYRRQVAAHRNDGVVEQQTVKRLGELFLAHRAADRARALLGAWTAQHPDDGPSLKLLADLEIAAEAWTEATTALGRLVRVSEGEAQIEAALRLVDASEKAGDPQAGRAGLELAREKHAADPRLADKLRALYELIGAHRELAAICAAEAETTSDPAIRYERLRKAGEVLLYGVGDAEAAFPLLAAAAELKPNEHDTIILLADAHTAAGRLPDATAILEAAMAAQKGKRGRDVSMLQHRMARVALVAGDRSVELAWLNVALESDSQNGQVAAELADVATELGQLEIALKALRAITLMKGQAPMSKAMAYLRQGMIAYHQGDARKAVLMAKKAVAEDPQMPEAQDFLREIGG